jgi:hypothetical protein
MQVVAGSISHLRTIYLAHNVIVTTEAAQVLDADYDDVSIQMIRQNIHPA